MSAPDADTITAWAAVATAIGGIIAFSWQYRQTKELKQKDLLKDILLPLICEFDNSKEMRIAKEILDEIPIYIDKHTAKEVRLGRYDEKRLMETLRYHKEDPDFDLKWEKGTIT